MKATMRIVGRVRNRTGGLCQALARQLLTRCTTGNRYQSDTLPMRPKKSPGRATFPPGANESTHKSRFQIPTRRTARARFPWGNGMPGSWIVRACQPWRFRERLEAPLTGPGCHRWTLPGSDGERGRRPGPLSGRRRRPRPDQAIPRRRARFEVLDGGGGKRGVASGNRHEPRTAFGYRTPANPAFGERTPARRRLLSAPPPGRRTYFERSTEKKQPYSRNFRRATGIRLGRIPDFPVTRSHPPASWPSAANSSICRTYRRTAGEESRRRSPVANRWMRP